MLEKLSNFIVKSRRVLKVTKRPNKEEFQNIVKVSGLGMLLIGFIGFILLLFKQILFRGG